MNDDRSRQIFSEIEREYGQIRQANAALLRDRRREVCEAIPAYETLLKHTRRRDLQDLYQNLDPESVKEDGTLCKESEEIEREKRDLLTQGGFPADYLSPISSCSACEAFEKTGRRLGAE